MANQKISQLTEQTDLSLIDGLAGYEGTSNVRISGPNIISAIPTIYSGDGTLSGNRNVNLGNNNLGFTNGRVGVGTASPTLTFETKATVASNWVARIMNESNTGYGLLVRADNPNSNITFATHNGNGYTTAFHGTGQVGINTSTNTPSAQLHVKGAGATNATTGLLVQNANGVDSVKVIDDGEIKLGTTTGSNNLLNQEPLQINSANGNITNYIKKSGGTWRILNFTGGEPYMTVSGSSVANVTFGTGQVLVNSSSGVHYKYGAAASALAFAGLSVSDNSSLATYPAKAFQNARITSTRIADKITNNGIGAASGGLQVFNTTTKKLQYWDESAWISIDEVTPKTVQTLTGSSPAWTIKNGYNAKWTPPAGAVSFSITAAAGDSGSIIIDTSNSPTLTFPASSIFDDGNTQPTLSGGTDIFSFLYDGSSYYWTYGLNFTP